VKDLLEKLDTKFGYVEGNRPISLATILDPRFKIVGFMNDLNAKDMVHNVSSEGAQVRKAQVVEKLAIISDDCAAASTSTSCDTGTSIWTTLDIM
jgi:hypothetical protein